MKNSILISTFAFFTAAAGAAQGPYSISIGSGDGSLSFSGIYSDGQIIGDDGMFDPPGAVTADYTVFRNYFMIHNVTDNLTYWADNVGTHLPKVPDGIVTTNPSGFTNVGINFGSGIIGGLGVVMAQPVPGQSAGVQFVWSFGNTSFTTKTLRMIWFLDVDSYLGTDAYDDDMCVRLLNTYPGASGSALAVGEGVDDANVNGVMGIKAETNLPATVYGVADSAGSFGSTYWWQNQNNFAGLGPEVEKAIPAMLANTVQNDANNNAAADVDGDVGAALQVEVDIPAGGTPFLVFQAVWGTNITYTGGSSVTDWTIY